MKHLITTLFIAVEVFAGVSVTKTALHQYNITLNTITSSGTFTNGTLTIGTDGLVAGWSNLPVAWVTGSITNGLATIAYANGLTNGYLLASGTNTLATTNGTYANMSVGTATFATSAGTATYSTSANFATNSGSATFSASSLYATQALYAVSSGYASNAPMPTTVSFATNALNATNLVGITKSQILTGVVANAASGAGSVTNNGNLIYWTPPEALSSVGMGGTITYNPITEIQLYAGTGLAVTSNVTAKRIDVHYRNIAPMDYGISNTIQSVANTNNAPITVTNLNVSTLPFLSLSVTNNGVTGASNGVVVASGIVTGWVVEADVSTNGLVSTNMIGTAAYSNSTAFAPSTVTNFNVGVLGTAAYSNAVAFAPSSVTNVSLAPYQLQSEANTNNAPITVTNLVISTLPFLGLSVTNNGITGISNGVAVASGIVTNFDTLVFVGGVSWVTAPVATNSIGLPGEIAYGSNYLYICVASNLWRRVTLGGW